MTKTKVCTKCGKRKLLEAYTKTRGYYRGKCRVCYNEEVRNKVRTGAYKYTVLRDPLPVEMGGYKRGAVFGKDDIKHMLQYGTISIGTVLRRGKEYYRIQGVMRKISKEEADEGDI